MSSSSSGSGNGGTLITYHGRDLSKEAPRAKGFEKAMQGTVRTGYAGQAHIAHIAHALFLLFIKVIHS